MKLSREWLNDRILPLAKRSPLSPNSVTLLAFAASLIAAVLLAQAAKSRVTAIAAIVTVAVAGLLDGLDGAIARAQQKSSRFGDLLDHFLDRVSDVAMLTGWCIGSGVNAWLVMAGVTSILLTGYLGTQIEASFAVRSYEGAGRAEFVIGLIVFVIAQLVMAALGYRPQIYGFSIPEILIVILIVFACWSTLQRLALAARLERKS